MRSSDVQLLAPTRHYASLDGLRGFAAFSVVIYHLGHWLNMPMLAQNSGLAVDLFFCLSGYVLPRAYENRINQMSTPYFMRIRLIRLMPLILLALLISAIYVVLRCIQTRQDSFYQPLTFAIVLGTLNVPYFGAPKFVGGPELFPLNGPQYTLFLELFINLLWWSSRRINQVRLSLGVALVCFFVLSLVGFGGDVPETFWSGFPRVGTSYFIGVALFNLDKRMPMWPTATKIFYLLCAAMCILFYLPYQIPRSVELVWVAILSPLLIISGTHAKLPLALTKACVTCGALSYPIYCLHFPVFEWVNGVYRSRGGAQNIAVEGPLTFICVLAGSYAALRLWDVPVRNWINSRRH